MGTKALARNKTNHLIWGNCILVTLFGTPFICNQQGSLSDMGMPPTWEKGSHLPQGTTKLGKLRDSHDSATAPTAKPDLGSSSLLGGCWSVEPTQGCQKCDSSMGVHRYTRWTGRLSHQTSDLSCPHNLLPEGCDLCFTWYQVQGDVGSDLPSYHQITKVTLTESSPERSGYMHMDKQVTHSILGMLFSTRGTETAKVEGLWIVNRPKCLVPEDPDNSSEVWLCSHFIVPFLNSMRGPLDIISWCHNCLLWSSSRKTTCMHIGIASVHLCICQYLCQNPKYHDHIQTSSSLP